MGGATCPGKCEEVTCKLVLCYTAGTQLVALGNAVPAPAEEGCSTARLGVAMTSEKVRTAFSRQPLFVGVESRAQPIKPNSLECVRPQAMICGQLDPMGLSVNDHAQATAPSGGKGRVQRAGIRNRSANGASRSAPVDLLLKISRRSAQPLDNWP